MKKYFVIPVSFYIITTLIFLTFAGCSNAVEKVRDAFTGTETAYEPGDMVSDIKLNTPDGKEVSLYDLIKEKPVLVEFGSYT